MSTATIIIAVLLVVAVILLYWSKPNRPVLTSFWDYVRHPEAMPDIAQSHEEVEQAARSLSRSPSKIGRLVDYYVLEVESAHTALTELKILARLGSKAYPRALEILRDPTLRERLTAVTNHGATDHGQAHGQALPESPINRLCEILDGDAPPPEEAAPLLAPFLKSDNERIRKSVALIIGSIASQDSFAELCRALKDKEEYVRSYALMGIQSAIEGDRIDESSKNDFFEAVAGMWPDDTSHNVCNRLPSILLKLNRERAIEYLLNQELMNVRFKPVWRIFEAFNEASVDVPRLRLLAIIAEASQSLSEYPMENILKEALPLLGAHRHNEDLPMLEEFLDYDNDNILRGATEALYRFHRYFDLIRDPWDIAKEMGWGALTVAEKHICSIEELDAEIKNGGFAQYYFNPSGDYWEYAKDGLNAIGANEHHRVLMATVNSFGDSMPSVDYDTRTSQLSKIVSRKEDPFNEYDIAWDKIVDENLVTLIFRYNLSNLEGRRKANQVDGS